MIFRLLPIIRIHCWGGLGSQLFALSLLTDLKERFSSRQLVLVQHSGGVTKRELEVDLLLSGEIPIHYVDDFSNSDLKVSKVSSSLAKFLKKLLQFVFVKIGLLATANSDREFQKIHPWVLSVRGHYAHRKPSSLFLSKLLSWLDYKESRRKNGEYLICLHYRLGDLMALNNKYPIPANRIVNEIHRVALKYKNINLVVFSDSPKAAEELLKVEGLKVGATFTSGSTAEVIRQCLEADFFVGTSSKISFWIIALRNHLATHNANSLPEGNQINIYPLLGNIASAEIVGFY